MKMRSAIFGLLVAICGSVESGTIRGFITETGTGIPIEGVDLDILDSNGLSVPVNASSSATGEYILQNVPAGEYIVRADPSAQQGYVDQYTGGVFLQSQAIPVTVPSLGEVISDFVLSPGALISGRVTVAGEGGPAELVDLDVFTLEGEFISSSNAVTDSNGDYVIGAFPPGNYLLRADPSPQTYLLERFYLSGENRNSASPIQIIGIDDRADIDFTLPRGGLIEGVVSQQGAGTPLAGQDLDLFTDTGAFVSAGSTTSATGFYQIGPVLPGNYRLRVDPDALTGLVRTFHPNALFEIDGQLVGVTLNTTASGVDVQVPLGGTVSGVIREASITNPIPGIDLDVYDNLGRRIPLNSISGLDGSYVLGGLPAGDYKVRADPSLAQGYALEYFQSSLNEASATFVAVTVGNETPGIDFHLSPAGTIQGMVVDASSSLPLAGIDLDLYDSQGHFFSAVDAISSATGFFILGPVPLGTWFLQADPTPVSGYADQYFENEYALARANPLVVEDLNRHLTADLALEAAGYIAGSVRSSSTLLGLSGIDLDVFFPDLNRLDVTTTTDGLGNYRLGPLPVGQYLLRADPPNLTGLPEEYYDGVTEVTFAQLISVSVGMDTAGIDFLLGPDVTPTETPTPDTSPTLTPTATPQLGIAGDFDKDGHANSVDLLNLLSQIGNGTLDPVHPADLNGNLIPEIGDLIMFTLDWGKTGTP